MRRKNSVLILAAAVGAISSSALAGNYANITVDGTFTDWASVPVTLNDPAGDTTSTIDITKVYIANDNDNLYLKVDYNAPVNPFYGLYLAFDTDQNTATGWDIHHVGVVGSEAGFQGDFPFQESTGAFNTGIGMTEGAQIAPWAPSDPGQSFTSQEYRISRSLTYHNWANPDDPVNTTNPPVFTGNSFNLMLWTNDPDPYEITAAIPYTFAVPAVGWNVPGSGDWNVAGNWTYGAVPNGVGSLAELRGAIGSPATVYSNSAITVGSLVLDNANMYVIAGAGTLTLQGTTSAAIDVLQGSHKINLPTIFQSNAAITVASGATLTLADPVTIKANKTVTKSGTVVISAPLTLEAGAVLSSAGGAMSVYSAPSLGVGARINVNSSTLDVDYRGISTPADTIRQQLKSGYANGAWNGDGINSGSAVAGQIGLGWVDDTANQNIKVRLARYGDANLSGSVDSIDFSAFLSGYGRTTTGIWAVGDFNYDQKVNTLDFNLLAGNFGQSSPAPTLGAVVPEPVSFGLAAVAALMFRRRR